MPIRRRTAGPARPPCVRRRAPRAGRTLEDEADEPLDLGRLTAEHRQRLVDLDRVLADVRAVAAEPEADRDLQARPARVDPSAAPSSSANAAMLASTTSSSRARTSASVAAASSSSVGSLRKGSRPAGGWPRPPGIALLRNHALNQPYDRWLPMMWPSVCRTVHSPPPGSASQSASASRRSTPCSSQRATAVACERRDRRSDRRAGPAAVAAPDGDRRDRRSRAARGRDRARSGASSVVDVGRPPAPAAARARRRGRQQVGDDGRTSGPRVARTAGWSGIAGTVASSISGSCIGQAYRPSASICLMTGRGPLDRPAGLLAAGLRSPRARAAAGGGRRPDRAAHRTRRRRRRPVRPRRLGRPGGHRPPAPSRLARVEPADPDARRGRPAAARRPPPRRGVPGDGRLAARRVEPQGLDRRPVRDPLRDLRPDARRRRDRLVGRRRGGDRRTDPTGRPGTTAARSVATSAAARSSARRRSTPTTCDGPRPTSGPRRCAPACSPASRRRRRRAPARRAARPPHAPPARRPGRDPRADRGRPARRAGPGRAAARAPPRHPAGQPARDPAGPNGCPPRRRPATSGRDRDRSAASATRGSRSRTAFRPVRGFIQRLEGGATGPVQARLGEDLRSLGEGARDRRCSPSPVRAAWSPWPTTRTPTAGPPRRRGSGSSSASRRCARAWSGLAPPTTPRPGCSAARRRRSCRSRRWPAARCAPRGAGRRRRSAARSRPSSRRWPATAGSSSSSTAGRRRSSRRCSAGRRPATGWSGAPGRPRRRRGGDRRAAAARGSPAARRPDPRQRRPRPAAGRRRRPGHGPVDPPVRRAGAVRRAAVLGGRAARTVTEVAVETLRERGEPARYERLLGEILVGLDRAGQLRRLATATRDEMQSDGGRRGARGMPEAPDGSPTRPTPTATTETAETPPTRPRTAKPRPRRPGRPRRAPPRPDPRRAGPARPSGGWSRSSPAAGGWPTATTSRAPRCRSPTGSSGPSSACCRPPARSPRPRSSSGSPRCSPATTCPTTASSGPASRATAAWPARPSAS